MSLDLVIRGGTVVDGTGKPGFRADLGIDAGRIAALGRVDATGRKEIDASGCIVAPGFIDIHTHYDAQVFWDRRLSVSPWHGVTSVVLGNCGFGIAPTRPEHRSLILRTLENVEGMSLSALCAGLGEEWPFETFPEFLDAIEKRGTAVNVGALVGHTPIRTFVMGEAAVERAASPEEVASQRAIVLEALEAGALGFSTSKAITHAGYDGKPVPSRVATYEEIEALAAALKGLRHGIIQATTGPGLETAQFADLAEAAGKPVTWTALLEGMTTRPYREILSEHARLQRSGVPVFPQVTPRPLMLEWQFRAPLPIEHLSIMKSVAAQDECGRMAAYADESFRSALRARIDASRLRDRFYGMAISGFEPDPSLNERVLADVADERNSHPVDLALDLALESGLDARFRMAFANADDTVVAELLRDGTTILGLSDAGAHASQLCDAGLPSTLLGKWVRERRIFTVEEAVRRLTSVPADLFQLRDRGRLAEGCRADVVVFDLERVTCKDLRRVYDSPGGADRLVQDAAGYRAVIVNGTTIRLDDRDVIDESDALPGQVLRGGQQ